MATTLKQMMIPQMPVKKPGQSMASQLAELRDWAEKMTRWAQFTQQALQDLVKEAGL